MALHSPPGAPRPDRRGARIEQTRCGLALFAPASRELRERLATVDGHFVPGHWSVSEEHLDELVELVGELVPVEVVDVRDAS
jgi:hypothetical protein